MLEASLCIKLRWEEVDVCGGISWKEVDVCGGIPWDICGGTSTKAASVWDDVTFLEVSNFGGVS